MNEHVTKSSCNSIILGYTNRPRWARGLGKGGFRSTSRQSLGNRLLAGGCSGRFAFLLPAATERLVKLDDGQQLITSGAGQIKFRREELLLRFENFVITGLARVIPLG